jgi:type VI secretion system secreted protein VgrG
MNSVASQAPSAKGTFTLVNPADVLALFGTGISQRARLIELETAQGSVLPDSLVVERFHGVEAVNALLLAQYDGAGQRRYANAAAAQQIAQLRLAALELPGKTFHGAGSARQMSAGARFTLTQHDHYSGEAREFKLLWVEHAAANNLPAQVSQLLQRLGNTVKPGSGAKSASSPMNTGASSYQNSSNDESEDLSQLERGSYRNRFGAVRAAVPVVPLACAAPAEAVASGPQTALVVGLAGEQLSTERNHAVKVQFA